MLISKVPDECVRESIDPVEGTEDPDHDYQTANELFELMARNHNFQADEDESLTTRDLVLLYKNIDLGTKLMSNANEVKIKSPNQYVETVIYNDDPETDSDVSENLSNEDLRNVTDVNNKERIDLLNSTSSFGNTLCHKLGGLQIKTSDISAEFKENFLLKDPFIKEQLNELNLMSSSYTFDTVLPASLLDYICCKGLEENHNFYMDNIIRYVKHTIDQLKRISNGDYLTDRAKEKWKEVANSVQLKPFVNKDKRKVVVSTASVPLHIERTFTEHLSNLEDFIHSDVDMRSISKLLERKIVLEIPQTICGTLTLFGKCCTDSLVISCKNEKSSLQLKNALEQKEKESRVDIVLKVSRSKTGQVTNDVSPVVVFQNISEKEGTLAAVGLPEAYPEIESIDYSQSNTPKIVEIDDLKEFDNTTVSQSSEQNNVANEIKILNVNIDSSEILNEEAKIGESNSDLPSQSNDLNVNSDENDTNPDPTVEENCAESDLNASEHESIRNISYNNSSESSVIIEKYCEKFKTHSEASFGMVPPDELMLKMQRLNMQISLPEESAEDTSISNTNKRKSPTRQRIKSPYENKSFAIEEKKRKKLLEIRQRREKIKKAMTENCKVGKHKYAKAPVVPQTSDSVTKLSITNKSFYNSIYGQTANIEQIQSIKCRKEKREQTTSDSSANDSEHDPSKTQVSSQKFVNRSFNLDDIMSEMMYNDEKCDAPLHTEPISVSTSVDSNEFNVNGTIPSILIAPTSSKIKVDYSARLSDEQSIRVDTFNEKSQIPDDTAILSPVSQNMTTPANTPRFSPMHHEKEDSKKVTKTVEFRKSIDKIYDLMNEIVKTDETNSKHKRSKFTTASSALIEAQDTCSAQCTTSGTSLKHQLTSSNPSYLSFDKTANAGIPSINDHEANLSAVVPKVIISSKIPVPVTEEEKKKERKRLCNSPVRKASNEARDDPLRAISQLLQEFENVQKNRQKPKTDSKVKQTELKDAGKGSSRGRKNLRTGETVKEYKPEKFFETTKGNIKTRRPKPGNITEPSRSASRVVGEERNLPRIDRRLASDIADEVKEARGEAVRGPSRLSRLNSLAQPKRTYVQAHVEEFQSRYGKTLMSDRLQRLAWTTSVQNPDRNTSSARMKGRKAIGDAASPSKQPASLLDRNQKQKNLSLNCTELMSLSKSVVSHNNTTRVMEKPDSPRKRIKSVESLGKTNIDRVSSSSGSGVLRARVPLIPSDIDLPSSPASPTVESSTLGSKLHHIIEKMIKPSSESLTVLAECNETSSKLSIIDDLEELSICENLSKEDKLFLECDQNDDLCQNHIALTDSNQMLKIQGKHILTDDPNKDLNCATQTSLNSDSNEVVQLQNALYRRMSVTTFQKRLRIRNLTLTPKPSMQQVIVLQSGDVGSIVMHSTITQCSKSNLTMPDSMSEVNALQGLSVAPLDFTFAKFPIQIATVGYAFPEFKNVQCESGSKIKQLVDAVGVTTENFVLNRCQTNEVAIKVDQILQCSKSALLDQKSEGASQVDFESINTKFKPRKVARSIFREAAVGVSTDVIQTPTVSDCSNTISIDHTTSLDILAGLLNEIQKITTCQTHITSTECQCENDEHCEELDTILNEAAAVETTFNSKYDDIVSISSLDKIRRLESSPSICSLFLSHDEDILDIRNSKINRLKYFLEAGVRDESCNSPIYADKEVSAEFPEREIVSSFTDTPSLFIPITVNHATNVSNSLVGVLSQPSSQFSFTERFKYSAMADTKKIIELPCEMEIPEEVIQNSTNFKGNQSCIVVSPENLGNLQCDVYEPKKKINSHKNQILSAKESYADPVLKMKRDILVTVYSILVFTIFAALSFPEMFYREYR